MIQFSFVEVNQTLNENFQVQVKEEESFRQGCEGITPAETVIKTSGKGKGEADGQVST